MNKTLISVLVANALVISTSAYAANNQRGFKVEDSIYDSVLNDAMNFGGHVGTSFEYEDKVTDGFNGNKKEERTKTHEVLGLYYTNPTWNLAALYSFKLVEREQVEPGYSETESSYKHLMSLNKGFNLSDGWTTGLIYDLEFTDSRVFSPYVTGLHRRKFEHSVRPYLTYWNNEYNLGFYSNLEYLLNTEDKSAWGERTEKGYSFLFKPYKRMGNWEFGVEFYYQVKDNEENAASGSINERSDFTEKYIEPIVQYSFDDAGTLYARMRVGENDTKHTNESTGGNADTTYFKDIRKATVGYEQAVGEDWLMKAEYEYANETESKSKYASWDKSKESELKQHTLFLQALYRF